MASASSSTQPEPEHDTSAPAEVRMVRYDQFYDTRKRTTVFRKTNNNATRKHIQKMNKKKPAIIIRRILDSKGHPSSVEVDLKNEKLAEVMREIYTGGEGMEISRGNPSCSNKQLFLALPELERRLDREMKAREPQKDLVYGLEVALEYIYEDFGHVRIEKNELLSMEEPCITFELLWTLFPPGMLLYSHEEYTDQDVISVAQKLKVERTQEGIFAFITSTMITHSGKHFGSALVAHQIPMFEGPRKLQDLAVYPLNFYRNKDQLRQKAIDRGKKLHSLLPLRYVETNGFAMYQDDQGKPFRLETSGRAMIDPLSYRLWERGVSSSINHKVRNILNLNKLTDEEYMICYPVILGFSFTTKRWGGFPLDRVADVEWSLEPFSSLVLNSKTKDLVHSMVKQHSKGRSKFDDVVKGKGKGLVGLLCGPPGGGKTLTAEAVAEATQCPLYCLSAGELGTHADGVESRLTQVLELAQRWKAVVLLDEADVFLAQRDNTGIERNALVSIFLRKLEYYQGILILTTNLVTHCDSAFESRIHFTIYYPELTAESRQQIWRTFISRASAKHTITEKDIKLLAQEPLNGRQIKNSVAVAESFANGSDTDLSIEHINTVLQMIRDWEKAKVARLTPMLDVQAGTNWRLVSFCLLTFVASIMASLGLQLLLRT